MTKSLLLSTAVAGVLATSAFTASADQYVIDTDGAHASINFKIDHLGFSYVVGRFNEFSGTFTYDPENPENNSAQVDINPASVDSNHAERDRHIRSSDYLDVSTYSEASFVSTSYTDHGDGQGTLTGELTLYGETRTIDIEVEKYGSGEDPWGGYRAGFKGSTELHLPDFGMDFDLGELAETVYLDLHVEGIRQ